MRRAASQLLRALRGKRSQVAFSRRLGYRGNPVTDWENGRRYPTAAETFRAAERVGVDVVEALLAFHPADRLERDDQGGFQLAAWLDRLRGSTRIVDLAERSGKSRFSVSRYLSGESHPRLPELLTLVDAITGRVPELVAELVPIDQVPALSPRYEAAKAARTIAFEEPWTEVVLRVLETEGYRARAHTPGKIARQLGVPEKTEERAVELLKAAALIRDKDGRYEPTGALSVETRASAEAMRALRHHWSQVAADRLAEPAKQGDAFAYNVFSVRREDLERIREIYRAAYRELRSLVAASDPPEVVALATLELVTFPD